MFKTIVIKKKKELGIKEIKSEYDRSYMKDPTLEPFDPETVDIRAIKDDMRIFTS